MEYDRPAETEAETDAETGAGTDAEAESVAALPTASGTEPRHPETVRPVTLRGSGDGPNGARGDSGLQLTVEHLEQLVRGGRCQPLVVDGRNRGDAVGIRPLGGQ